MLIILTLATCAGILLLLAHADRRTALYKSPISPATATEQRWIALGYELALKDQEARGKELAIDILRLRQETETRAIGQCVEWLESRAKDWNPEVHPCEAQLFGYLIEDLKDGAIESKD